MGRTPDFTDAFARIDQRQGATDDRIKAVEDRVVHRSEITVLIDKVVDMAAAIERRVEVLESGNRRIAWLIFGALISIFASVVTALIIAGLAIT